MKIPTYQRKRNGVADYREVNLSRNRIGLTHIREYFGKREFTLTELEKSMGVSRLEAQNLLNSLKSSGHVNSPRAPRRKTRDKRIWKISPKGIKYLPRKKVSKEKQEKENPKEIIKEVPVEKLIEDREKIHPIRRV